MTERLSHAWREMWRPPRRFDDVNLERRFLVDYGRRFAPHRRVAAILGFLIDIVYLLWDYLYSACDPAFAPHLEAVVWNRSITSFLVLPFIAISFGERFKNDEIYASRQVLIIMTILFPPHCRGFLIVPFPYASIYSFMGMFICQIYGFSMMRLRSRPVIVLMATYLVLAALTFSWNWQIKQESLINPASRIYVWLAFSFLVSVGTMGILVCTLLERSERASFMRNEELARRNEAIKQHNHEVTLLNEALRESGLQAQEKAQALIELKERMRQDAERRNREKSQFLAAAVHDLKQPIQAIGNALEPGRRALDRQDVEKARGMFDLAASATQLMREQLAGVLEISRL